MYFCFFFIIFPRKSPGPSFEQTLISFTQGCFVPSLVEIGPLVLDFQNSFMYFRYFVIFSPWKRAWPFIWTNSPSPKDALCQVWLKLTQGFRRRRRKCEKFSTTTTTDSGQIVIRKAHLSLWLRWAKINSLSRYNEL